METDPKIDKLKKRIDGNRDERARYQKMYQDLQDRTREIVEAKDRLPNSFWCEECKADFIGRAFKIVRKLKGKLPIAWWFAYCPSRHRCIKRISEKKNDLYYLKSYVVRRDRSRYRDDLLTPDDARFWMLYGHKHGFDGYKALDNDDGAPPHDSPWGIQK